MSRHPALQPGRVAVITGAASGIGRAVAERCVAFGMKVCMVDIDAATLEEAEAALAAQAPAGAAVRAIVTDVGKIEDIERMKEQVYGDLGEVALLMNNAGQEAGGQMFGSLERWQALLATNLWGVINGVNAFVPAMIAQGTPCAVVNTGSKQGITTPPGNTAYNISKAGVKVLTEALAHELRQKEGCAVTAHLLVPGSTFTGFTRAHTSEKPEGAWLPEQVIDYMLPRMAAGEFYILCPDNEVTREIDERRVAWAAGDVIENRPALSRWHPDYRDAFATFMAGGEKR